MKTAENKSTHSQQHTQTEHSSGEQEHDRPFFSESAPQHNPFFNPGAASWVQGKFFGEQTPFFSPSSTATIQRMPAFESEENRVQAKIAPGVTATTPQIQLADTKEQEPEEDTSTDTDLQTKLASNAVDPPEDMGESGDGLPFTQAKLTIGKPNDRYEREADAVANQVVAMPKQRANLTPGLQTKALSKSITKLAQRQVASVQPKRLQELPKVQKQGDGSLKASSDVASRLSSSRGGGSNLDENTRGEMESSIGADFGNVRVHTGSEATQLSQDLGAKAFTHGSDIYFNQGQYNPNSSEGKHLLAHELTHTVQQGASIQRKIGISTGGAPSVQLLPDLLKRGINWVAERTIPGYTLLNVVLGKNLITGAAVERSGVNLIKGYMRLSPVVGSILLSELKETETLPQAGKWVEGKVAEFGIDFNDISRRLGLMWDEMSVWKGKSGNVAVFKKYLGPVIGKFMAFSSVVMEKVKELRFEGALRLVGATELLNALKKNPKAFKKAIDDPKTVLKQFMVGALKKGFANFKDNFITHFKGALLGWLFGKAAQMGIQMPQKLNIVGLFSLIAQLVGATYTKIRAAVVKRLGPKGEMIVSKLETTVTFIKDLVTKGPIALWERVKSFLTNLKEMVFSKISALVSTEIIKTAVTKLLSMLNPAGAIVQLAMTLYRVIKFFIDNWETIKSVAMGILNSIGMVALNKIGPAAAFVEKILAQGMQLIIGFLARIFGLGGIVDKVKTLIKKISDPVKKAIGKVIGWLVKKAKSLWRKQKVKSESDVSQRERRRHQKIIQRMKDILVKPFGKKSKTFKEFYVRKKKQALRLVNLYQNKVRKGIKVSVNFTPLKEDFKDKDLDLFIKIAPNSNESELQIPFQSENKTLIGKDHKTYKTKSMEIEPSTQKPYKVWDQEQGIADGYLRDHSSRKKYELVIYAEKASLVYKEGLNLPAINSLYIMDNSGNIYAIGETEPLLSIVTRANNHSQLFAGDPVACAGHIISYSRGSGSMVAFDNKSGHYKPDSGYLKNVKTELEARIETIQDEVLKKHVKQYLEIYLS